MSGYIGNKSSVSITDTYTREQLDNQLTPVGTIIAKASDKVPDGFLKCDGSEISRTIYADLFDDIGTLYGSGDGSTTFNLPDFRGEFLRGSDDGRGVDTGRSVGSHQDDETKSHSHTGSTNTTGGHTHSTSANSTRHSQGAQPDSNWKGTIHGVNPGTVSGTSSEGSHSHTVTINSTGGSETRPRNFAVTYCIKY